MSVENRKFALKALGLSAILSLAVTIPLGAQAQEVKAVKLGHAFTEAHPRGIAMQRFADDVAKATDGQVKITVFANGVLGSEQQMLQSTRSDVQQLYMGAMSPIAGFKKELQVFDFPFLFATNEEVAHVLDGPVGQRLLDSVESLNLRGLTWAGGAFRDMANSKRAVNTLEGMKGLKVRVMPTQVAIDSFRAMGINPVPMAYSEVFTALETGALDGHEHPPVDMLQNKMFEVEKYLTITGHVYTPVALIVSKKWFDSLSPEHQKIVREIAAQNRDFQRAEELRQAKDAVAGLAKHGMTVSELAPGELDKIRAAVQPIIEKHINTVGPEFFKEFHAALETARAK